MHHCGYLHDDRRRPRGARRRTAQVLNSNAELTNTLEKATDESSDLEVMHSVYGADTRIRDLAGAYGMVEPSESVTLDFSQDAAAGATRPRPLSSKTVAEYDK